MRDSIYLNCPIDSTRSEIHLLEVLPGELPGTIECKLCTTCLDDNPLYYTLSYVWGEGQKDCSILVNGARFLVTKNLQAALRQMRANNGPNSIFVWVDAICINQIEDKERNHQVGLMEMIYSLCKQVLIWMGECESPAHTSRMRTQQFQGDNSDFKEQWTDYLATFEVEGVKDTYDLVDLKTSVSIRPRSDINYLSHCAWFFRLLALGEHFTNLPPFCLNFVNQNDYISQFRKAMEHLCHNSWFRRIWVVQESVLAPSATVLVPSISLPLKVLVTAGENLKSHTTKGCCATSTSSAYMDRGTIRTFLDNINEILYFKSERKLNSNNMSLFPICLSLSQREAKEDIDRVYGCLGLVTKWLGYERMHPDYGLSVSQVYLRVCTQFITSTGSLLPLSSGVEKYRYKDLPSWAIDFTNMGRAGPIDYSSWLSQVDMYNASRNWVSKAIVRKDTILVVGGIEFDSIFMLGNVMNFYNAATRTQTFREWQHLIRHPDQVYPGGGTWRDAWWYTVCGGCCWGANSIRRIDTDDVSFFSAMASEKQMDIAPSSFFAKTDARVTSSIFFKYSIPSRNHFADIMNMVSSTVHGRRLFVTMNGYLGLGREDILVGDRLFILSGGHTPFLLRQSGNEFVPEEEPHSPRPLYKLIGELFVHGVMDGEIVERYAGSYDNKLFIE